MQESRCLSPGVVCSIASFSSTFDSRNRLIIILSNCGRLNDNEPRNHASVFSIGRYASRDGRNLPHQSES